MIKSVKFVGICVSDQDKAVDFYTKRLGFSILTDQAFNEEQRWIELKIPGGDTRVVLFTPKGQEDRIGSFVNMAFHTDNMEKTYTELVERGVEFVGPPKEEHWGTFALFKDLDGNTFCLSQH